MLTFAIACLLVHQQPKVSVSTGGAPVEAILRDLSQQSGIRLHASDSVRGEILIVEAKDIPLKEMMQSIADADGAEWSPDGTGYSLGRSGKIRNAQENAEMAERTASIAKSLEEHLKSELAPISPTKPQFDAGSRLAWRALQAVGPAGLARVKSGIRIVYSTDPNPAQQRWAGNFQPLYQTYISELKLSPREVGPDIANGADALPRVRDASRALITITSTLFQGYVAHVYVFDAKGSLIVDGMANLQTAELDAIERQANPKVPGLSGQPLVLSDSATEFLALAKSAMSQRPVTLSPNMISRILDPGKYDPLGLFVGDALATVSKSHSRALVASVPDFCFITGLFLGSKTVTEEAFRRWLELTCIIDESRAGWMIVRPRYPVDTRELRVDREKMGAFYRTAWKNGGVRLGELGAYIASQPRRYVETISLYYAFFCMPEIAHMFDPDSLGTVRTYGMLTEKQRALLEAGKELPVNALSPEARAELADWIYNGSAYSFASHEFSGEYVDPTDAFPNGVSMPAFLVQRGSMKDAVIPLYNGTKASDIDGSPLDADSLGFELGRQDLGEQGTKGTMSSFLLGKKLALTLELSSPRLVLRGQMQETRFDRNARPLALEELPVTFQEVVKKNRSEYFEHNRSNEPARNGPPPP